MSLKGNLNQFDLTSVFQLIYAEKKTGLLRFESETKKVSVFVREGNIAYATDAQADTRLGCLLKSGNVITDGQLKRCLEQCHEEAQDLGRLLVDQGLITPEILHEYVQKQTESVVFDLFSWEKGDFEYRDIELNPKHMLLVRLNIMKILLEGSRRVDEMQVLKKQIPSDDLVFKKSEEIKVAANALTEQQQRVFSLVNGTYSVKKIIKESGYDEYSVYKTLKALSVSGAVSRSEDTRAQPDEANTSGPPKDSDTDIPLNELDRMRLKRSNPGNSMPAGRGGAGANPSYNERFYHGLVGKQLDSYGVIAFIGSGRVGGVFKGWDGAMEREVALKVIGHEISSQPAFCDMFVNRARMISNLDHPNIAQIYDVNSNNDILYYAMELVNGETLASLIRRHRTINTVKGMNYLITVCTALDFLKKNDVVHCAITPWNIMIDSKGAVKVVDFGWGGINHVGQPLDHRSDIYSLGAAFYHAFSGHPPFEGDHNPDARDRQPTRPLTPLNGINPKIPNVLEKIIEKMMAEDPGDRFQDYESLVTVLKNLFRRARVKTDGEIEAGARSSGKG